MAPDTAVAAQQTEEAWVAELVKAGLTKIEIDRQRTIRRNEEFMARCGVLQAADAVQKSMDQDKAKKASKPKVPKRKFITTADGNARKSARLEGKPRPDYYKEDAPTRVVSAPKQRRVRREAVEMDIPTHVDIEELLRTNPAQAWQVLHGWKECCGTPSQAAADAAYDAAEAFAAELTAEERPAYAKRMTHSQVERGFWSSVPRNLGRYYGDRRRFVLMLSDDQADRDPDTFIKDTQVDNSTCWEVNYVPRTTGDSGWSGGWVHFAIDHMLSPGDAVVFEVLDDAQGEAIINEQRGSTSAGAEQSASLIERSAGAAAAAAGAAPSTASKKGSAKAAATAAAAAGAGVGPKQGGKKGGSSAGEAQQQGHAAAAAAKKGGSSAEGEAKKQQGKAAAAAAGAKNVKEKGSHGWGRLYVRAFVFRASAYETEDTRPQRPAAAAAGKAFAAAAGTDDAGVSRQPEATAAAADAKAAAAQGEAGSSKQQKQTAAAPTQKKRARGGGAQDPPLQEQQQGDTKPKKKSKTAAAAAAPAAAAGAKGSKQQGKPPAAAAAAGGAGAKKSKSAAAGAAAAGAKQSKQSKRSKQEDKPPAAAAAGGVRAKTRGLVPQPANKSVLVPPPTDDEVKRNATLQDFEVSMIMEHKVFGGADQFLIRWSGFGPYWDSWEGVDCLNQPPRTYNWAGGKQAIPTHLRK